MFEAKLLEGNILKKIVEAIKDVVNDVNIDVSPAGKLPILSPTASCLFGDWVSLPLFLTFTFRALAPSNGRLTRRPRFPQPLHGGL